MKTIHRADERGKVDIGWLKSNHSFSFGNYYNPEKTGFGLLRVLNDDYVEGGQGFDTHPHNNMEIFTLMLEGELAHKDSMGTGAVIYPDEIQIMSAGTGVYHSEVNNREDVPAKLLQIWIFPKERNITPRYDQMKFPLSERQNQIKKVISGKREKDTLYIHQDAAVSLGNLEKGSSENYSFEFEGNGVYIFNIEGKISVNGEILNKRDAIGISNENEVKISAEENSNFIIIEVPMN